MRLRKIRHGPIAVSFVSAACAVVVLGGCFGAPEGPASAAGTRMVGEDVEFWFGGQCADVTAIDVDLRAEGRITLDTWSVESADGAMVETFTVGVVPDGFAETDPLEVDPSTADIAVATITRPGSEPIEDVALIADLLEDPAPADTEWRLAFYGWMDADEVRKLIDDGELAPACT